MDAECLVRVEGSTGSLWILGDELEIGERCQGGHHEGEQERQPNHAAHRARHGSRHGIDASAEDVTHNEQQQ